MTQGETSRCILTESDYQNENRVTANLWEVLYSKDIVM